MSAYLKFTPLLLAVVLSGCDAWPTVVNNGTSVPITIRYHQREYDSWSRPISVQPNKATRLAREHWIQDITGIEIKDRDHTYQLTGRTLIPLRNACPSIDLARRLKLAPDCYLFYLGTGHLTASSVAPRDIVFEQLGSGS